MPFVTLDIGGLCKNKVITTVSEIYIRDYFLGGFGQMQMHIKQTTKQT